MEIILDSMLTLIAILNPFGNIPLFMSLSDHLDGKTQKKLFKIIVFTGYFITVIFTIIGTFLMKYFFKIDIVQIQLAGGILLFCVGLKNLVFPNAVTKKKNLDKLIDKDKEEEDTDEEIKKMIIPMAFPMMVGPGTLTTVIFLSNLNGNISTIISITIAFVLIYLFTFFAVILQKVFGKLVLFVISRVMQVFVMAIGIKIFLIGLKSVIEQF